MTQEVVYVDATLFRQAVYFVGFVLLISVVGIVVITITTDKTIPDVLQNIAVGSLTGLVGLLVQRSTKES